MLSAAPAPAPPLEELCSSCELLLVCMEGRTPLYICHPSSTWHPVSARAIHPHIRLWVPAAPAHQHRSGLIQQHYYQLPKKFSAYRGGLEIVTFFFFILGSCMKIVVQCCTSWKKYRRCRRKLMLHIIIYKRFILSSL